MKWYEILAIALFCIATPLNAQDAQSLTLAKDGETAYSIVISTTASPSTSHAAEELQHFLNQISSVSIPIVHDSEPLVGQAILLGDSKHLRAIAPDLDLTPLGEEGYLLRTAGPHLIIAGGALRGNLYGVYALLEEHLGCRWFTPEVSRIPARDSLVLPVLNESYVPVLEAREVGIMDCYDADWAARNRINSNAAKLTEKHGGRIVWGERMFVHTFDRLVPPDEYFDEHPEYFALVNGKRLKEKTQLCTTNEEVVQLVIDRVRKAMRTQHEPGSEFYNARYFSVSQNDWRNYCECDSCQALAEQEDAAIAPILYLVNRVAEAIEEEFPQNAIETLAYQGTRKAPRNMRPRPNVIIRLAGIECCFSHPLETCDGERNPLFVEDVKAWSKAADRLWIWDYSTAFWPYQTPFPNRHVLQPNLKFFLRHNVRGIFMNDTFSTLHGEFSQLDGYLQAKLLWNPDYDVELAMTEFLQAVYGDAATPIRRYIDLLRQEVEQTNFHMGIWVKSWTPDFLSDSLMDEAIALWDAAEAAVQNEPILLERVRIARLPTDFVAISRIHSGRHPAQDESRDLLHPFVNFDLIKRAEIFFQTVKQSGITEFRVGEELDLELYRRQFHNGIIGLQHQP